MSHYARIYAEVLRDAREPAWHGRRGWIQLLCLGFDHPEHNWLLTPEGIRGVETRLRADGSLEDVPLADDPKMVTVALRAGANRHPVLLELLPPHPPGAQECASCRGDGQLGANLPCSLCAGCGWVGAAPLVGDL